MAHLDDTAIVGTDAGEWGIRYFRVSDDLVQNGKWKDSSSKNQTIKALITKHNYLHSAYRSLLNVEPIPEYYPYIKQMALREPYSEDDLFPVQFEDIEYALFALAKYKKTEDITIIQQILKSNSWQMGQLSFRLMEDYSDAAYLDVYEKYYPRQYYRKICRDQTIDNAVYFIRSLTTYKNDRSARILDSILNRRPFIPCAADTNSCRSALVWAIWTNNCKAYQKLRSQVKREIRFEEENSITLPLDPPVISDDTSAEPIRWW